MNNLSEIRQVLAEMPEDKTFTAKELWELFEVFQPLFTEEQKDQLIDHLRNSLDRNLDRVINSRKETKQ